MYEVLSDETIDQIERILLKQAIEVINNPTRAPYIKVRRLAKDTDHRPQEFGRVISKLDWIERQSKHVYKITDEILEHPDIKSE